VVIQLRLYWIDGKGPRDFGLKGKTLRGGYPNPSLIDLCQEKRKDSNGRFDSSNRLRHGGDPVCRAHRAAPQEEY
jgi:hypothetical protein